MKRLLVGCVLAASLIAPACGDLLDPAAAVVNGQKITVDEISADLERFESSAEFERLAQQGDAQELKRQVEQQLLSQEIRRRVLEPRAQELGIEVSDEDVNERLDRIKQDFETEGAFEEALKEQGLTLAQLTELLADSLLEEELRAKVTEGAGPSEEELQAFYEENQARFQEADVQHILVKDKSKAAKVAKQLQGAPKKKVDDLFAKLAKRFSIDETSARNGGDLGTSSPADFVPPFQEAVVDLDIGRISDPVKTQFGFHVIRVTDRTLAPFEEVAGQIEQEIGAGAADEAWQEYIEDAFAEAEVEVNPRYGEFDEEALQVVDPTAEDVPGAEEPQPTGNPTQVEDPGLSPPPEE